MHNEKIQNVWMENMIYRYAAPAYIFNLWGFSMDTVVLEWLFYELVKNAEIERRLYGEIV